MIDLTGLPGGAEMICGGAQQYPAPCIRLVCFQGEHVFVTTVGPHENLLGPAALVTKERPASLLDTLVHLDVSRFCSPDRNPESASRTCCA